MPGTKKENAIPKRKGFFSRVTNLFGSSFKPKVIESESDREMDNSDQQSSGFYTTEGKEMRPSYLNIDEKPVIDDSKIETNEEKFKRIVKGADIKMLPSDLLAEIKGKNNSVVPNNKPTENDGPAK